MKILMEHTYLYFFGSLLKDNDGSLPVKLFVSNGGFVGI